MSELAARTVSQGLQAFVPVAIWMTWAARRHTSRERRWTRIGIAAAGPGCVLATELFGASTHQSQWEAVLAATALLPALWLLAQVTGARSSTPSPGVLAGAILLLLVRQVMEIGAALV